jgi:hypothetical protein
VITSILTLGLDIFLVQRLGSIGLALGGCLGFAAASGWYLPYLTSRTLTAMEARARSSQGQGALVSEPGVT